MCHYFNLMPFPHLLTGTIDIWTCRSQHLSFLLTKKMKSNAAVFCFHQRKKSKPSYFGMRTNGSNSLVKLPGKCGMEFCGLSKSIIISRYVSLLEATGTAPNTHKISDNGPESVASTRRPPYCTGIRHFQVQ